jgi:hypothetical protein
MTWRLKSQHGSTLLLHVARCSWRYAWTLESRYSAPHTLLIFSLLGLASSTDLIRHTTSYLLHFVKIISIAVSLYLATTCSFFSFFLLPNRSPHVYSNCPIQHKLYIADIQKIISLLARGVLFTNASFCSRYGSNSLSIQQCHAEDSSAEEEKWLQRSSGKFCLKVITTKYYHSKASGSKREKITNSLNQEDGLIEGQEICKFISQFSTNNFWKIRTLKCVFKLHDS